MLQGLLLPSYNALRLISHIYKLKVLNYINFKVPGCAGSLYFPDWSAHSFNFYLFKERDFPFTLSKGSAISLTDIIDPAEHRKFIHIKQIYISNELFMLYMSISASGFVEMELQVKTQR